MPSSIVLIAVGALRTHRRATEFRLVLGHGSAVAAFAAAAAAAAAVLCYSSSTREM